MSYVSENRNYTDKTQSGADSQSERVGDITGEHPVNAPSIGKRFPKWLIYLKVCNSLLPKKI